jgi:hypothetical protein
MSQPATETGKLALFRNPAVGTRPIGFVPQNPSHSRPPGQPDRRIGCVSQIPPSVPDQSASFRRFRPDCSHPARE